MQNTNNNQQNIKNFERYTIERMKEEKDVKKTNYDEITEEFINRNLMDGEANYGVTIENIKMYSKNDRRFKAGPNKEGLVVGIVGEVTFRVRPGFIEWRVWNNSKKTFENMDFSGYKFDYVKDDMQQEGTSGRIFERKPGKGVMVLPILRSRFNKLHVILPTERDQDDNQKPAIATKTNRMDWADSRNNDRLKAALEAYVRIHQGKFEWEHPTNRNSYNEMCSNCQHVQVVRQHDGISEDFEGKISQKMTTDLTEDGQYTANLYCPIFDMMADEAIKHELNYSNAQNWKGQEVVKTNRYGEEYKTLKPEKEEVVGGHSLDPQSHIDHALAEIAEDCTYYHKIERKDESRIASEKAKKREEHGLMNADIRVDAYFKERAEPGRVLVDTEVGEYILVKVDAKGNRTSEPAQVISVKTANEMELSANQRIDVQEKWLTQTTMPEAMKLYHDEDSAVCDVFGYRVRSVDGVYVDASDDVNAMLDVNKPLNVESIDHRVRTFRKWVDRFHQAANRIYSLSDDSISRLSYVAMYKKPEWLNDRNSERWDKAVDRFIARGEELMLQQEQDELMPEGDVNSKWDDQ